MRKQANENWEIKSSLKRKKMGEGLCCERKAVLLSLSVVDRLSEHTGI